MKRAWLIGGVSVAIGFSGLAAWWFLADEQVEGGGAVAGVEPTSPGGALDPGFVRDDQWSQREDAGVGPVSGRVVDFKGRPVAGAEVLLFDEEAPTQGLTCGLCGDPVLECGHHRTVERVLAGLADGSLVRKPPILRTVTDARGQFSFAAAPFDRQLVVVSDAGWGEARSGPEPLEFELEVDGRLPRLVISRPDGTPILGAQVTVYREETGEVTRFISDTEGKVPARAVPLGAWVGASFPGLLPAMSRGDRLVLAPPAELEVRAKLGQQLVAADIVIGCHGAPQTFQSATGVVRLQGLGREFCTVSASAQGLVGASKSLDVEAPRTELEVQLQRSARLLVSVVSESGEPVDEVEAWLNGVDVRMRADARNGSLVELGPVPEGEYELRVSAPGMNLVAMQIDLGPGETSLDVVMHPMLRVTGRVTDAQGRGVSRIFVTGMDSSGAVAFSVRSGPDGGFEAYLELGGTYVVSAEDPEWGRAGLEAQLPGPPVELKLERRAAIELVVTDADGKPYVEGVNLLTAEGRFVGEFAAREGGGLRYVGLDPGEYLVKIEPFDRLPVERRVSLAKDATVKLQLQLERGETITGKVLSATGAPVEGANVLVDGKRGMTSTDQAGNFVVEGLPRGEVILQAAHPETGVSSGDVTVKAPTRGVELRFPPERRVRGRVVDPSGRPIPTAMVNDEHVGSDGRFELMHASYIYQVSAEGYGQELLIEEADDLGDIVLQPNRDIVGEVRDEEGRPVSGASVREVGRLGGTTSDTSGRFKLVSGDTGPVELLATRGALSGRATSAGATPVLITMRKGTRVVGRVLGANGQGFRTSVSANSDFSGGPTMAQTDAMGSFSFTLSPGVWRFEARGVSVARVIEVRGEEVQVVLGEEPGGCGLVATAPEPIGELWLLPVGTPASWDPDSDEENIPGLTRVHGGGRERTLTARGLPCGAFRILASSGRGLVEGAVELRGGEHRVTLTAKPPDPSEVEPE